MKIENKHWIIIAIVVILIALWYFFMKKKPATTSNYAGMYGSFGNESNFRKGASSGIVATKKCPTDCDAISTSTGPGCRCYKQGSSVPVYIKL